MQSINFFHLIGLKQSALDNEIDNRLTNINRALDQASSLEEMMQYTDYNIIKGILMDKKKKKKYLKAIEKWNIAPTVGHWTVKYYIVFIHILIIYMYLIYSIIGNSQNLSVYYNIFMELGEKKSQIMIIVILALNVNMYGLLRCPLI